MNGGIMLRSEYVRKEALKEAKQKAKEDVKNLIVARATQQQSVVSVIDSQQDNTNSDQ